MSEERDRNSVLVIPQPLVHESENHRSYILEISDDEGEEDIIEKMYGPFEKAINTAPPYPKQFTRIARNADLIRHEQILKLREAIKDRENRQAQNLLEKKKLELANARPRNGRILFPENEKRQADFGAAREKRISITTNARISSYLVAQPEPIVIDSDSDENMEVDTTENDTRTAFNETLESRSPMAIVSSEELRDLSEKDDSDEDSFETARDIDDSDVQLMQDDQATTQEILRELNEQLEAQYSRRNDIKVKLLGNMVKLSIEKNRKESIRKEIGQTSPSSSVGNKRLHTNENPFFNKNPWTPTDHMPTFMTHDMSGLPMAFSQQIPAHPQHLSHQQTLHHERSMPQQVLYDNRYNLYMNSASPPPPPPPDTMPPPYIPPPPPPMSTMSPPPSYKRARRMNRNKEAWHRPKRFTPAMSPYADLNSPISRMENAEELQSTLDYVIELITVRIFSDKAHEKYPANVDRKLPKSRRLVTVDRRSFASPTNGSELEDDHQSQIVFISPAGLPVKLEISDSCHESPLLGLLYRKYRDKPFAKAMEFAVPSIFSWIPSDVDLSNLHSNEFGGIPVYGHRLRETYNMVCDLFAAYPSTEFFGALRLELSMYVNGRESEHFLRDCQDCVRQFPDSIDVFWQIVLAETDREKQICLIQEQLQSIKLSSSTVTMVISEKTTELLIRTLRLFGLGEVLALLTDGMMTDISDVKGGIFLLDQVQYANDDGKYFIWLSILHYYVMKSLPATVCDIWMSSLIKYGTPSREKPLFTIDWENALKDNPVDKSTLCGATNILLSMLRYFGNSAIGNVNKKPLLVGVLSTLFSFLRFTKCYELIGTLVLTQQLNSPAILRDVEEIRADLTSKTDV